VAASLQAVHEETDEQDVQDRVGRGQRQDAEAFRETRGVAELDADGDLERDRHRPGRDRAAVPRDVDVLLLAHESEQKEEGVRGQEEDEQGRPVWTIRGRLLAWGKQLTMADAQGREAARIRQQYFDLWSVVADWNPELRYNEIGTATPDRTDTMILIAAALVQVLYE